MCVVVSLVLCLSAGEVLPVYSEGYRFSGFTSDAKVDCIYRVDPVTLKPDLFWEGRSLVSCLSVAPKSGYVSFIDEDDLEDLPAAEDTQGYERPEDQSSLKILDDKGKTIARLWVWQRRYAWSPDGERIACFTSKLNKVLGKRVFGTWIVDVATLTMQEVPVLGFGISWSPKTDHLFLPYDTNKVSEWDPVGKVLTDRCLPSGVPSADENFVLVDNGTSFTVWTLKGRPHSVVRVTKYREVPYWLRDDLLVVRTAVEGKGEGYVYDCSTNKAYKCEGFIVGASSSSNILINRKDRGLEKRILDQDIPSCSNEDVFSLISEDKQDIIAEERTEKKEDEKDGRGQTGNLSTSTR